MAINKYDDHLFILPEDGAYRSLSLGFIKFSQTDIGRIQIGDSARGWQNVLEQFSRTCIPSMERYQKQYTLLLLDFDGKGETRVNNIQSYIPSHLEERVFFLGCQNEAEDLKRELGGGRLEKMGETLAQICYDNFSGQTENPWACIQLRHNARQVRRLTEKVRPFIFQQF